MRAEQACWLFKGVVALESTKAHCRQADADKIVFVRAQERETPLVEAPFEVAERQVMPYYWQDLSG